MASKENTIKRELIIDGKDNSIEECLRLAKEFLRLNLAVNGKEEIKLVNRKDLEEEILKNLPAKCPFCDNHFNNSFYLVNISDGSGSETYAECLCENYREIVKEYDG